VALSPPHAPLPMMDDDPPTVSRRLSYARGTVSFNPRAPDDWVSAVVNRPITTGDRALDRQ